MDSELLELQKLFEATQEAKSTVRLSERNVVELVSKLQELQLLDSDLLHSVTGKEYITKAHLKTELEAEIDRLGRVSLVDLATSAEVELIHCERIAEQIVADRPELMFVQGEIISDKYWDGVSEEVSEALRESGQISVGELAKRYNVGAELLTRALESRMGSSGIQGKLEAGQLYTPAFVARIKAMVRGAIRALTVPTPLSEVWSLLQRELREGDDGFSGVVPGLFQTVLNGIIAAGEVSGSLRGGVSWIPVVFTQAQRESVEAFYSQNGFISYDFLRKLVVPQPKLYLQEKYPEGIPLETVFIHTSVTSVLDAAAEEALNGSGWVDTLPLVPSSFTIPDVTMLLNVCPSVQKCKKESTGVILAETCVVSLSFVKIVKERLDAEVRALAEKAAKEQGSKPKKVEVDGNGTGRRPSSSNNTNGVEKDLVEEDTVQGKNQKKRRANQNSVKDRATDDADEESKVKGSKSKKKGGRSKGGISLLAEESGTGVSKEDADVPSQEMLSEKILEWYSDMETAGIEGDDDSEGALAKSLADWVRPSVLSTWKAAKRSTFSASSEERRRRVDDLQHRIDETYANLQLYEKTLDLFDADAGTSVILQRHILRTTAAEIVDMFLIAQNLEGKAADGDNVEGLQSSDLLSTGQRLSLARNMPGAALSTKAVELVEALEGKSIEAFGSALDSAVQESGLRLKKLDKKSEKSLLFLSRKSLKLQIEEETDPVALLPLVVALLFIQVHNRALHAPGRALTAAIAHLKGGISEASYETLLEYQKSVVKVLQMQATAAPGENDCTNDRIMTKREVLVDGMPLLKAIAIPHEGNGTTGKS